MFCNTPPQEQGINSLNLVIATIYALNITINVKEAYKPINLNLAVISNNEINISIEGMIHATQPAIAVSKGDCPSCTRNFW